MRVIVTMAGEGSRAKRKYGGQEKYKLTYKGKSFFWHSLIGLQNLFDNEFDFIGSESNFDSTFVEDQCRLLGISKYNLYCLRSRTTGQAETVMALEHVISRNEAILVVNIDTYAYLGTGDIEKMVNSQGAVFTTKVEGTRWSFVKTDSMGNVIKITEKIRISDLGSTGHYYFKYFADFCDVYNNHKEDIVKQYKESYIAPMYTYLLKRKTIISVYLPRKQVVFLDSIPKEQVSGHQNI